MRIKTSTTNLPLPLQQEIDSGALNGKDDKNHYRIVRHNTRVSRKEVRKQDRSVQKVRKAKYFSHGKKRPAEDDLQPPSLKRAKYQTQKGPSKRESVGQVPTPSNKATSSSKAEAKFKNADKPATNSTGSSLQLPRTRADDEEDLYIRQLEQQLGYSKELRKRRRPEDEDGLEDLFDWADNLYLSSSEQTVKKSEDERSESEADPSDIADDVEGSSESESKESWSDEWGGIDSASETESNSASSTTIPSPPSAHAYIPPHMRKAKLDAQQPSEEVIKLTRKLKGLLNRMSETNIFSIIDSIEEIYRKNPRNAVTSTLTNLIIDGISSHSTLLDSYVVLHGAVVASLHKLVGIEFATHFVQETVNSYEAHYAAITNIESDDVQVEKSDHGKESSNLIILISELYNFQVISCVLLFDIIRLLLDGNLTEFDVELLLKILRSSGQQLRQDDPLALKDIVQIVQDKVVDNREAPSSRTRFMVETLLNLKNNKVKNVAAAQSQGSESMERMKKFLSGLNNSRTVLSYEPLRMSLQDLHSAETKGKWWIVGAAWGGNPLVDRRASESERLVLVEQQAQKEENNLLKLARKQGMNSDIRRSIFVVIMGSEDYVDACERLSQLRLSEVQQREIVRVLLHCCGNERSYNPYYSLICQHLCKQTHSYKITIQFCLWDFLRDLGETKVGGAELLKISKEEDGFDLKSISKVRLRNVAKCYAWWIAKDTVSLTILKPVDFTILKPQAKEFLRVLFSQVFFSSQLATPLLTDNLSAVVLAKNRKAIEEIFIRASKVDTLAMGLVYFLAETFKPLRGEADSVPKFLEWAVALATETLRTGLDFVRAL